MPQLSRCFQTERNRSSQRVKTSVLVRYSRHWSFVMETAPSLVLSFTLCSIPPLFHFHCPLLILYPLACPSAFTFMNLNSSVQKLYMLCSFLRYSESLRIWFLKASNIEATDALTDCDFQWNASISLSMGQPVAPIHSSQCFTDKECARREKNMKEISLFRHWAAPGWQ